MSDVEHELVKENRMLREIALRALRALREAQDTAGREHEEWIDRALSEIASPTATAPE